MKMFERTLQNLEERRERVESGFVNGIPIPFERFSNEFPVIEKTKYYHITASTKVGKCFGKGTKVVMYDGSISNIEDIKGGDLLLGPDSIPRKVEGVTKGTQEMFKITQDYGKDFVVNKEHILYLRDLKNNKNITKTVEEYLSLKNKENYKMIQSDEVVFNSNNPLPISAYFYGLWLGDGDTEEISITNIDKNIIDYLYLYASSVNCKLKKVGNTTKYGKIRYLFSQNTLLEGYSNKETLQFSSCLEAAKGNKRLSCYISRATKKGKEVNGYKWRWINKKGEFREIFKKVTNFSKENINPIYLTASIEDRYKLLAGIIDADGYKNPKNNSYDLILKQKSLIEDISFLCRSLGLRVTNIKERIVEGSTYYRIRISGYNCYKIPVLLERKQCYEKKVSSNLYRNFNIESIGKGDYYGFTVDKDHLFLLDDFTIVHNTQIADYLFLYSVFLFAMNHPDKVRIKIFYFTLEMSKTQKYHQLMCHLLYRVSEGKIRVTPKQLRSTKNAISKDILNLLETEEYQKCFKFFEENVVFIDNTKNPFGIYKIMRSHFQSPEVGHQHIKKIKQYDELLNTYKEIEIDDYYEEKDPDLYTFCIVDHMALMTPENNGTVRDAMIKFSSDYALRLRDKYNAIVVGIIQQAAAQEGIDNYKYNRLKPTLDGYGDAKVISRDADLILGLYNPARYEIADYMGYKISLFKDNIRFLEIIAGREGGGGSTVALYFDGGVNFFKELPLPTDTTKLQTIYNKINKIEQGHIFLLSYFKKEKISKLKKWVYSLFFKCIN